MNTADSSRPPPVSPFTPDDDDPTPTLADILPSMQREHMNGLDGGSDDGFRYDGKDAQPPLNPFAADDDRDEDEGEQGYSAKLKQVREGDTFSETGTERGTAEPEGTASHEQRQPGMNGKKETASPVSPAASRVTSASNDEFPGLPHFPPNKRTRSSLGSPGSFSSYPQRPSFHPAISRLRSTSTQTVPSSGPQDRLVSSSTYDTALEFPGIGSPPRRPPYGISASPSTAALDNISRRSSTSNFFDLPSTSELPSGVSASIASSLGRSEGPIPPARAIKWSSLKRIAGRVFPSAAGVSQAEQMAKSAMGQPTVMAVSGLIAVGTSKGWVMIFDFGQNLRCVCGTEGIAKDAGAVTAVAVSQDHTYIAAGHENGAVHLYALTKPAQPARSVPPVSLPDVLAGRREGHLAGSKILHLGFVGARHTAIVSSDDQGLAFYHALGKVLMLASTDIIRMLGRYPDPADAPKPPPSLSSRPQLRSVATAPPSSSPLPPSSPLGSTSPTSTRTPPRAPPGKKPTAVLSMAPLPLGPAPHPSTDSLSLVALLTPTKLVVVGLKPSPRTWHRVTFPRDWERGAEGRPFGHGQEREEVGRGYATSGVVGWWPSARATGETGTEEEKREGGSKKKGEEKPGEDPLLAWAWGRRVGIVRVKGLGQPKTPAGGKAVTPVGVEFEELEGWSCEGAVLGLRWYNERIILVFTSNHFDVYDLSTRQRIGRDAHDIRSVTSHDHYASAFDSTVPLRDVLSYSASFSTYKRRLFLLLDHDLQAGAVLTWADRILALMQPATILEAIELTTAYFQGHVDASTITLPDDPYERQDILEPKLREILNASLDFVFSEERLRDGSHSDGETIQQLFEGLVGTCARACFALDDPDWLFDDLFERYEQNGIENIFLDRIEPFILAGAVHALPPSVSQRLIGIHAERKQFDAAQRIIWSVDPQTLDINQALVLCQREKLYDALAYVYNRAMRDYVAPLVEFLALIRRIERHRRQRPRRIGENGASSEEEGEEDAHSSYWRNGHGLVSASAVQADQDVEATVPDAYKVFAYLSQALAGLSYPKREALSFEEAKRARDSLYSFLFSGQTRAWPEKGGRSVFTSVEDGGDEPTYPYLHLLLQFDAEATLDTLDLAFEDPYLDEDDEEEPSTTRITRQRIIDLLLEIMAPPRDGEDDFSPVDRTFLNIFVARNFPKYIQYISLPPATLRTILVNLSTDSDQSTVEDRQLAAEYLLSNFTPSDVDSLIPLFKDAGFFRILRSVYRGEQKWGALASTYLGDPDVGADIFAFLRETLKLASRATSAQKEELAETILEAVPSLVQADEDGLQQTADLVDSFLPSHHSDVVDRLAGSSWRQFAYLRCLLEPTFANLPDSPSRSSDRSHTAASDPSLRSRYLSLLSSHEPQHVIRYLETDAPFFAQSDEVLRICERSQAFDAVVWIVDRRGEPVKALERADEALESRTDLLLQQLFAGGDGDEDEDEDEETAEEGKRSPDALLEQISAVSVAATAVCVQRSTSKRRPKDPAPEDLWFHLLSSLVGIVRSIRTIAPAPPHASDRSSSHRRPSDSSVIFYDDDDEPRQLSSQASTVLSSLIPNALSALVTSTSSLDVSFPRLMRRLIETNSRSPAANRSYSEFKAIVTSMLDTYAFEGDLLDLSTRITEQDLFQHVEEYKRERDRGWRPGDENPLGECAECLQSVWGPQGAGSSPPMSRSASVSMVVEAMGMNGRPRMKKRPSLKGKEVDWPEFNSFPPSGLTASSSMGVLEPPRGVVVGRDGRLWHQTCHLLRQG